MIKTNVTYQVVCDECGKLSETYESFEVLINFEEENGWFIEVIHFENKECASFCKECVNQMSS